MDHSPLCPAFVSPLSFLTGQAPGPCECGVTPRAPIAATAVAEPPTPPVAATPSADGPPVIAAAPETATAPAPDAAPQRKPRKPRAKKSAAPKAEDKTSAPAQDQTVAPPVAQDAAPAPTQEVVSVHAVTITLPPLKPLGGDVRDESSEGEPLAPTLVGEPLAGVLAGVGEPQTVTIPPEPECDPDPEVAQTDDAPAPCAGCWGERDDPKEEFCQGCRREFLHAAQVAAKVTPAPASEQAAPATTAATKKPRKPRGKKTEAAAAAPEPPPTAASSPDAPVASTPETPSAPAFVVDSVNLKPLTDQSGPKDSAEPPKPSGLAAGGAAAIALGPLSSRRGLDGDDKAVFYAAVAKNACSGCLQGLLLEGDGMEPVISNGGPGELSFTPITSPDQHGEKWHRACLEQKVRIEKEGRLKVNPKDGTYEILDKGPADDLDALVAERTQKSPKFAGMLADAEERRSNAVDDPPSRDCGKSESIDSTGATESEKVVISAASDKKDSGMVVGMKGDTITFTPAAPATSAAPKPRRRLFAGVDPGSQGYIAVIDDTGAVVWTEPMPTTGGDTPIYDEAGMTRVAKRLIELGVEEVLVERQQPIDRIFRGKPFVCPHCKQMKVPRMTAKSNFGKGLGFGLWRGMFAMGGVRYDTIAPITWKRALGIAGGDPKQVKKRAIDKAQTAFPGLDLRDLERSPRARTPNSDKAEALLLARFLMLTRTGGLAAVKEAPADEGEDAADDESEADEVMPAATSPVVEGLAASLVAKEAVASVALDKGDGQTHYAGDGCSPPHASATEKTPVAGGDDPWLRQMTKTMSERKTEGPKPTPKARKTTPAARGPRKPASPAKPSAPRRSPSEKEKALARVMKSIGKKK